MIKFLAMRVKNGYLKLADIPKTYRKQVEKELENL